MAGTGGSIGTIRGTIEIDYDGAGILRAERDIQGLNRSSMSVKEGFDKASTGMLVAGGVIAAGFGVAADAAISFEKRLSAVGAVSGASEEQMKALSDKALQLGKDTSFSASEAAVAMEELVKAGLSVDDVLNGAADATVSLAAAGEVALPEAATIASNAMNQFALKAEDLPKVADLIAGAANSSAIDVRDFGFSLGQVGAVAHLAGQSFDDTATAIALMGNAGIKGSDAGTSLKTFLSNLIPTTDSATAAMEELGIITKDGANKFVDAQGNFKSMSDIAGILQQSMKGLSESQQQVALETIFGSDAIRAASVIAKEGKTGFDELNKSMTGTTAAEVAAKRLDNTAGSIEQLKGSAETLAISIGTVLLPVLRDIVDGLTSAVNWFNGLSDGTKQTLVTILGVVGGLALLGGGLIKIVSFAQRLNEVLKVLKIWQGLVKAISLVTKIWTGIQWLLNVALNANPIGLIIIGVLLLIGAIILLWKNSETFRNIVMAVWNAIKVAIAAVVDWLVNTAWPWIKKVWEGIVDGALWLWGWIVKIWNFIWDAIKFYIDLVVAYVKFLISIWESIIAFFVGLWNRIVQIFTSAVDRVKAIIEGVKAIIARVRGFFEDMRQAAIDRLAKLIENVKAIPGKILDQLKNIGTLLYDSGKKLIQGLIDGIKNMANKAKEAATGVLSDIRDLFPFSPAKEGPFSGRGWTLYSGMAMVDDLAKGIARSSQMPVDTMTMALAGVAAVTPSGASAATTAASSSAGNVGGLTVGTVNVQGVWDFTDPVSTRNMVGTLHDELDKYAKGYQ